MTIERGGEEQTLEARARRDGDTYRLGFAFGLRYESYGLPKAVGLALETTWEVTKAIGASLGRIVTGSGRDEVASVVGITAVSQESLEAGFRYYLQVLAFISLSLALLNMLPLLPLDGGHIAFSILERIRGRAIPREAYERVSAIGIALVLFLFVIGLTNDIDRPAAAGKPLVQPLRRSSRRFSTTTERTGRTWRAFYRDVLGLRRVSRFGDGMVFRLGDGVLLLFDAGKTAARPDENGRATAPSGSVHTCFLARPGEYETWKEAVPAVEKRSPGRTASAPSTSATRPETCSRSPSGISGRR